MKTYVLKNGARHITRPVQKAGARPADRDLRWSDGFCVRIPRRRAVIVTFHS